MLLEITGNQWVQIVGYIAMAIVVAPSLAILMLRMP
jgi:hypothetical protein